MEIKASSIIESSRLTEKLRAEMSKMTASKLARHDFDKTTEGIYKRIAELVDLANTRHALLTDDLQSLKEIVHPFHYQDKAMT